MPRKCRLKRPLPRPAPPSSIPSAAGSLRQQTLEESMQYWVQKKALPQTDSELSGEDEPRVEAGPESVGTDTPPPRRSARITTDRDFRERREVVESPFNSPFSSTVSFSDDVDSADVWEPMREDLPVLDSDNEELPGASGAGGATGGCADVGSSSSDEGEEELEKEESTLPPVGRSKRGGRQQSRGGACGRPGGKRGAGRGAGRGKGRGGPSPAADEWKTGDWYPRHIPFTADPGPCGAAAALQSENAVDFLQLFMSDELLEQIVLQTNLYADQCIAAVTEMQTHARARDWLPVDVPELKIFLGLHFLTGIIRKPELSMYWSTEDIFSTPFFNKTMSRNRFQILQRFLHFTDNATPVPGKDRMFKIRPVLDHIVYKFREMYQPNKNICIDEGTLLFRGRLSFKVYNPMKPVKYGIKSYILCDSETGYCFNMRPYCGRGEEQIPLVDTVVGLLDGLAGNGHRLYMDNFYNSVGMCDILLNLQTHVCGTLRRNRGEPPLIRELTTADLKAGEIITRHNNKVMVLGWRDKNIVRMISTFHENETENVTVWQKGQKGEQSQRVDKLKPSCVVAYNKSMNGVDRLDQSITYYPFVRKSNKWTNKFVTYLFEICMHNAFIIYRNKHPQGECKCLLDFMKCVIKSWTSPPQPAQRAAGGELEGRNAPPPVVAPRPERAPFRDPQSRLEPDLKGHVLAKFPPTTGCKGPRRRCRVCSIPPIRCETRWYCKQCNVALHPEECYSKYHSEPQYMPTDTKSKRFKAL